VSRSIVGRLIAKDLHLFRWLILGAVVAGVASLALSTVVPGDNVTTGLNLGILLFITTIITFGIFIAMVGILKERQDRSRLFVLSLPVSPAHYAVAKVSAALVAFLGPWLVLTGGVVLLNLLGGDPGKVPAFVVMMTFFLANYCVLVAVVAITLSEVWAIAGILVTNTAVPVFLAWLGGLPQAAATAWSPAILSILAVLVGVILLSLALALTLPARQRDVV
jgi:ABC-2 type transport system permease protein